MRHQLASIYGYIVTRPIPLLASSRAFKALLLPVRPIPLWTARRLFSSLAKNYFNLLSSSPCPPSSPLHPPPSFPISTSCSNPTGDGFTRSFSRPFFAQSAPWFMETRLLMSQRAVLNIRLLRRFCGFLYAREDWMREREESAKRQARDNTQSWLLMIQSSIETSRRKGPGRSNLNPENSRIKRNYRHCIFYINMIIQFNFLA